MSRYPCPHCQKTCTIRSRQHGLAERLLCMISCYPFRCDRCGHRFRRFGLRGRWGDQPQFDLPQQDLQQNGWQTTSHAVGIAPQLTSPRDPATPAPHDPFVLVPVGSCHDALTSSRRTEGFPTDHLITRLDALEQHVHSLTQHTHRGIRRLRWWRGLCAWLRGAQPCRLGIAARPDQRPVRDHLHAASGK